MPTCTLVPLARNVVELVQVTKAFEAPEGGRLLILREINLEVAAGESLAVVGPSGSGKSTLLNLMGTLDRPTSGRILWDGEEGSQWDETRLAATRNGKIGFVFQAHHLLPQCTVLENVLVPTLVHPDPAHRRQAPERARQLLERVGLGGRLGHFPGQLSGGERQRAAVVRALINRPRLLLADEPTGALDRAAALELGRLLVELNREEQVTLVLATHALDLARQMQRVLELRDGRLAPA